MLVIIQTKLSVWISFYCVWLCTVSPGRPVDFWSLRTTFFIEISILEDFYGDKCQYSPGDSISQLQLNVLTWWLYPTVSANRTHLVIVSPSPRWSYVPGKSNPQS